MGLEVSRIFALAEGSFHIRNTKKATLGTSSKMSQNRTLRQRDDCKLSKKTIYFICSRYCRSTDILCRLQDFQFEQLVLYFHFVFLALSHIDSKATYVFSFKVLNYFFKNMLLLYIPGVSNVLVQDL